MLILPKKKGGRLAATPFLNIIFVMSRLLCFRRSSSGSGVSSGRSGSSSGVSSRGHRIGSASGRSSGHRVGGSGVSGRSSGGINGRSGFGGGSGVSSRCFSRLFAASDDEQGNAGNEGGGLQLRNDISHGKLL